MAASSLNRTNTSPSGSGYKYTFSAWIKRSKLTDRQMFWRVINPSATQYYSYMEFQANDTLHILDYSSNGTLAIVTNRLFRDTSAWYHIMGVVDTTEGTASNRVKLYVNGTQETSFASTTYTLGQNQATTGTESGKNNYVGGDAANNLRFFDGYMSHVAFVDGQALTPTTFGQTDSTSGIWKFKNPSGVTFGNNGYHLKFENSGNLGLDSSGEGHNLTVSGNGRQALDTPSNVHATMNSLVKSGNTFTNGNLTITQNSGTSYQNSVSTSAVTKGKWYVECKLSNVSGVYPGVGIIDVSEQGAGNGDNKGYFGSSDNPKGIQLYSGGFYSTGNNNNVSLTSNSTNDIIGIALDLDSSTKNIKMYRNGTLITGTSVTPPDPDGGYAFGVTANPSGSGAVAQWNFGNGYFGTTAITSAGSNGNGSLFEYDVPSGYYALNTKNINTYG